MSVVRLRNRDRRKRMSSVGEEMGHYLRYNLARSGIVEADNILKS